MLKYMLWSQADVLTTNDICRGGSVQSCCEHSAPGLFQHILRVQFYLRGPQPVRHSAETSGPGNVLSYVQHYIVGHAVRVHGGVVEFTRPSLPVWSSDRVHSAAHNASAWRHR